MAKQSTLPKGASLDDDLAARIPTGLPADVEDVLPRGATKIALPKGARPIEEPTFGERLAEIPTQFVAGLNDVTAFLAKPFEQVFGTVSIGEEGIEILTPEETEQRRSEGRLGLPGMARREPTSLVGRATRVAGQTAVFGPIVGRVAGFVPKPTPAVTRMGRFAQLPQRALAETGKTFAKAPVATTAIETGIALPAGAGGFIAEKTFPDSDAAVFIGEVIGGTAPALMPIRLATRAAGGVRNLFETIKHPFTEIGGRKRAAERAKRAVPPEQRKAALKELEEPTVLDPETGKPVLTPAQRTGEQGLLSLERAVMDSSEELRREADINIAHANQVIQDSLREVADVPVEAATANIKEAQDYLSNLLDTRIRISAQRIDERIEQLGPKASREQLNRVAGEEIEKVLTAARLQEKELYRNIPDHTAVPFRAAQRKLEEIRRQLGKAQQEDIPEVARRFLNTTSKDFFGKNIPVGFRKGQTRIRELRSLQSKLREVARNARAGDKKNLNQARIADDIATAITDDLADAAAGDEVVDQLQTAIEFSRELNHRFGTSTLAKILGRRVTGAERVPAGLTLEESIGVTGPKAREALDDLIKAFDSPEAPSSALLIDASEDFLRTKFLRQAVQKGDLNIRAAQRFMLQNEEILNRLPKLSSQIEEAIQSGEKLAVVQRQRARVNFDDPRISKATMLIERGPVETFRQISKLKPETQAIEIQKLINRVAKDETGEALLGLKSGFLEFLFSASKEKSRDIKGLPFIAGFDLQDTLSSVRAGAKKLFTADELNRIDIAVKDLIRLENRRAAKITKEGVISDKPSKVIEMLAGITGAAVGRTQARRLGIGGTVQIPGIFAERFRSLVNAGVKDPASRLIRDMVFDEELFKELIQSGLEDGGKKLTKKAELRLNIWTATVLAEYGGAFEEKPEELR